MLAEGVMPGEGVMNHAPTMDCLLCECVKGGILGL